MICPNCGEECTRDMVDVGVGEIPSGPWGCENCHWVEPTPRFTIEIPVEKFDRVAHINNVLEQSDEEVGPACSRVGVPVTIDMTEDFREPYCQGYRHALADVRRVYRRIRG